MAQLLHINKSERIYRYEYFVDFTGVVTRFFNINASPGFGLPEWSVYRKGYFGELSSTTFNLRYLHRLEVNKKL